MRSTGTRISTYAPCIALLEEFIAAPLIPAAEVGLQRARTLLDALDNPQTTFRVVHVAGSSGKGSTTTMIGSILRESGHRTGLLRSPHLVDYTERIAVDGDDISREAWVSCFSRVWPIVELMANNRLPGYHLGRPSFSEVILAIACLHFRDRGISWAAIETGMGGRLDATNTLPSDVAVITNISLEHTRILGSTLTAIAGEKAGIIKAGRPVISAASHPEPAAVIRARAAQLGSQLVEVPGDVHFTVLESSLDGSRLRIEDVSRQIDVSLALPGGFQALNAATACAAAWGLADRGVEVPDDAIVRGLGRARIAGRLEVARRQPLIILDGAHAPAATAALRESLDILLPDRNVVLLFAALNDKDVRAMLAPLLPRTQKLILTTAPGTSRSWSPEAIAERIEPGGIPTLLEPDPETALNVALATIDLRSALVVCGSLYLVGHIRAMLQPEMLQ